MTDRYIRRQLRIAEFAGVAALDAPAHKLHKHSATNCGNHGCLYCQNPRKRGELTMQERKASSPTGEVSELSDWKL